MKKQIVLENDQLIEMVNESAKRVLRGLMTEGWLDDVAEKLGYIPQGGSGGTTARMVYDENGTAYLLDANNKPMEGFKVFYDNQGNPLYFDANGNKITVDNGQGGEQQGNWLTNQLAGTPFGDFLGIQNPNQPQYSDDMAAMYLQNAMGVDQQITDLQAQIDQMEKTDPNNPMLLGLKQNMQMLNTQKNIYQPYLQGYYSNLNQQYNDLAAKMRSGQQLTPDEMNKYTQLNQTLMGINGSSAYQYMAPTQGPFQNSPVLNKIASFLGFNNNNQQQQQGAQSAQTTQAGAQQSQNAQGGQQRQVQQQRPVTQQRRPQQQRPVAQQRQQRPVVQQRQPAPRPAVVSTGATNQTTQQSATTPVGTANASTVTPQPPATANRVINSGQQPNANGLHTQVRSTPALGNTVAGRNFNPQNLHLPGVKIPPR